MKKIKRKFVENMNRHNPDLHAKPEELHKMEMSDSEKKKKIVNMSHGMGVKHGKKK